MPKKKINRRGGTWRPILRTRVYPVVPRAQQQRWAEATDSASYLHSMYFAHRDRLLPRYFDKFEEYPCPSGTGARLRWYLLDVGWRSWKQVRKYGRSVRQRTGESRFRQLWNMLRYSIRQPMSPKTYYRNDFHRPEVRERANEFLHRHELKGVLYPLASPGSNLEDKAPLNDKLRFADKAQRHDLPVASTVASVIDGKASLHTEELPRTDLFVKPRSAKGGSGAQLWRYIAEGDRFSRGDGRKSVQAKKLLQRLASKAKNDLLVQRRLVCDRELSDLSLTAIPTLRLVTMTDEQGDPVLVTGMFRMPTTETAVVDNLHAGGIAARINTENGTIKPALSLNPDQRSQYDTHPVSGAVISGRKIPNWNDVVSLVRDAHRSFSPRVIVGWDVCPSENGPVLVEGNSQPGVGFLQGPFDEPLGNERFGQLLAHHIRANLAEPPAGPDVKEATETSELDR